ncbi:hypothetical protein Tco_1215814 [Tanacetum coccineum]
MVINLSRVGDFRFWILFLSGVEYDTTDSTCLHGNTRSLEKRQNLKQEYIIIPICTTDPLISQGTKDSEEDAIVKPIEFNKSEALDKYGKDDQDTGSEFERLLQLEKQPNSTNSFNTVGTHVSAVGPSFTNDDPSSPINAARTSEEHLFE